MTESRYALPDDGTIMGAVGGYGGGGQETLERQITVARQWESGEGAVEFVNGGVDGEIAWLAMIERASVSIRGQGDELDGGTFESQRCSGERDTYGNACTGRQILSSIGTTSSACSRCWRNTGGRGGGPSERRCCTAAADRGGGRCRSDL